MSNISPFVAGAGGHRAAEPAAVVDPAPRPVRRTFTAEYRARVAAEYEAAPHGDKGAVLRREVCTSRRCGSGPSPVRH